MIPMSLKQRIALAIKGKQNASQQGVAPPMSGATQPLAVPSTMATKPAPMSTPFSSTKPLFGQSEKSLNPKFFNLKKKMVKF